MDENTIGFKEKKVLPNPKWVPCPDHKLKKFSWFERLILPQNKIHQCIHADSCENYEHSNLYKICLGGYWK